MQLLTKKITNNLVVLFLSIFIIFGFTPQTQLNTLLEYNGTIEHLVFNTLIAFPEKALDSKNAKASITREEKITPTEFEKILMELYSNNYILISPKDLFFIEQQKIFFKPIYIPRNKKPIIFSFDNVTYKSSFQNTGEIDKIIIDNKNNFATYSTKQNIQNRISYNNEFIPILENFIKNNPDFSHNNARGIIFFTADNGLLGYKTDPKNANSKHDIKRVSKIVRQLKYNGWEFGSNNYSYTPHLHLNNMEFTKNITNWLDISNPITGETTYYAAPADEHLPSQLDHINILNSYNFNVLFYNDFKQSFEIKDNSILMSRKPVTGRSLLNNRDDFANLFDCNKVYEINQNTSNQQ